MSWKLSAGEYTGEGVTVAQTKHFLVTYTRHRPEDRVAIHEHERPYFCLVSRGGYREESGRQDSVCQAGSVVFHPGPDRHSDRIAPEGAACLNVECLDSQALSNSETQYSCGSELSWLAVRLLREIEQAAPDSVVIDSLGSEMLGNIDNSESDPVSDFAKKALRILENGFDRQLSLSQLAEEVGVHPIYLARSFRRSFHCSLGDRLRQIRVRESAKSLADESLQLAEIALTCGFYDQSHFTNAFRRTTGMTPRAYRTTLRKGFDFPRNR